MAPPIIQQIRLDLAAAERQLADLQRRIDDLSGTVEVPVDVAGGTVDVGVDAPGLGQAEQQIESLRGELGLVDDEADRASRSVDELGDEAQDAGRTGTQAFG